MKNIKKGVGKVAAVGLISMLSLGGLSSVAFAADLDYSSPQEYKESMTVDGDLTVSATEDLNNDGLINEGDTLSLNLHIENSSDNDYNYVDVSSRGLDLNRLVVSESLPAGESVDLPITYTVKAGDEIAGAVSHNVFVNVRDETRIENTAEFKFRQSVDSDEDVVQTGNSKLSGLIMNKDTGNIHVDSIDDYDNYYGIDESRLTEDSHRVSVGDGFVYAFDFTNDTEETITLNGMEFVENIVEENVSGTVVEPGETANLYVISEITRDDLDWGISSSKTTVGGGFDVVLSDTNENTYLISSGSSSTTTVGLSLLAYGDTEYEEQPPTANANLDYIFSADEGSATAIVDGVSSETFGFIENDHVLTDSNEVVVEAPEAIVLESGESFVERAFVVYRGLYHSLDLNINPVELTGSYSSDTGGGIGDEFPAPTLNEPVCGEEAQVVLPQEFIDEYNETHYIPFGLEPLTYEVEKQDDNTYYVYAVDWNFPMLIDEWTLEIPEVVPCPVEAPDYEEPVFNAPTCDSSASLKLPVSNEFYTYSSAGSETADGVGVLTAEVRNAETDELVDSWKFEYTNPTDCDPVVEIPDYEVPTFVPGTCDTDYVLNVPEDTEYYKYSSSRVSATDIPTDVFGVRVYSQETDEMLDSWTFEYERPTGCDPVDPPVVEEPEVPEEETPEVPVDEETPVVEEKPETPVKEVPKKVNSGEVSEVVEDNNVAVFALIAGAGVVVALTTGLVLVRSRKK